MGAIEQVIMSNGLLVGFAWEQSFDKAIEAISSNMPHEAQHWTKLALAIFCVVVIVPAWRWYLLPMEILDGYKFGFVIDHEDPKLAKVLDDPKWKKVEDRQKGIYSEGEDSSTDDSKDF